MPRLICRLALITSCALALGAGAPALAGAVSPHANPVKAKTALVAKIESLGSTLSYMWRGGPDRAIPDGPLGGAAASTSTSAYYVSHVPASPAQLPEKLEWLLGLDLQIRGDDRVAVGSYDFVYHHLAKSRRLITQALSDYRLSNYYIGQADTLLGIPHRRLAAEPYTGDSTQPPSTTAVTPTLSVTARLSLAATVQMGAAAIAESVPQHLFPSSQYSLLGPDETASQYYSVLVSRMHVSAAQRAAQRDWVTGTNTQRRGDDMLFLGLYLREASRAADQREANAGLVTLRRADSEINRAEAALGVHHSGPSARLPRTIVLGD